MVIERDICQAVLDRLRILGFETFEDYLRSDLFRRKLVEYRTSWGLPAACLGCKSPEGIPRHRSLVRLGGHEIKGDLIPLCDHCSQRVRSCRGQCSTALTHVHLVMQRLFRWNKPHAEGMFRKFGGTTGWVNPSRKPKKRRRRACDDPYRKLDRHASFIARLVERGYSAERIAAHYRVPAEVARTYIQRTTGSGSASPPWETSAA